MTGGTLDEASAITGQIHETDAPGAILSLRQAENAIVFSAGAGADKDTALMWVNLARNAAALLRYYTGKADALVATLGGTTPPATTPAGILYTGPAEAPVALDGTSQSEAFSVTYTPTDGGTPDVVIWLIDDVIYRDNDSAEPYEIRYNNDPLPIDTAFTGDGTTGEQNTFTLVPDGTYTIKVQDVRGAVIGETTATITIPAASDPTGGEEGGGGSTNPVDPNDPRTVIYVDGNTVFNINGLDGSKILDQPNTIYDFQNSAPGNLEIAASYVEARNITGTGTRRIGIRNGEDFIDAGYRDFEFTFAHLRQSDGGALYSPYFINGVDVNPQLNVGDNDTMQIYAYQGDVHDPLVEGCTIYGKTRPAGSNAHNDTIQITGLEGGVLYNPTIRNCHLEGSSNVAIMASEITGLFTIESNLLSIHPDAFFAVNIKSPTGDGTLLYRDNDVVNREDINGVVAPDDNLGTRLAAGAPNYGLTYRSGWTIDPNSEGGQF